MLMQRNDGAYYLSSPSNQIPNLAFLYSHFLGERGSGQFIEVGAYDGLSYSPSWGLAVRGWNGLMIEPIHEYAELCRGNHRDHPNVRVVERAVSNRGGALELHLAGCLTSASAESINHCAELGWTSLISGRRCAVESSTLDELIETANLERPIDVLIVDVEGHEELVFEGFDLVRWRPAMLIVELHDTTSAFRSAMASHRRLSVRLQAAGYEIAYKDHINTVFVSQQTAKRSYEQ